jgi:hypothetical protein
MSKSIHWPPTYSVPKGLTLRLGGARAALVAARLYYMAHERQDDQEAYVGVRELRKRFSWLEQDEFLDELRSLKRQGVISIRGKGRELEVALDHKRLNKLTPSQALKSE